MRKVIKAPSVTTRERTIWKGRHTVNAAERFLKLILIVRMGTSVSHSLLYTTPPFGEVYLSGESLLPLHIQHSTAPPSGPSPLLWLVSWQAALLLAATGSLILVVPHNPKWEGHLCAEFEGWKITVYWYQPRDTRLT